MAYVMIGDESYEIDTDEDEQLARQALSDAGIVSAPVYEGEPDGLGDSRKGDRVLFAAEYLLQVCRDGAWETLENDIFHSEAAADRAGDELRANDSEFLTSRMRVVGPDGDAVTEWTPTLEDARKHGDVIYVAIADDGNSVEYEHVGSAREAAERYVSEGDWGEIESTIWITVYVHEGYDLHGVRLEFVGETRTSYTIALDPEEPECQHADGHDWRSPFSLLGGLRENPGVWGHGAGAIIREVCVRCGCERTTDTWAQNHETGEQGLTSVRYEEGAHTIDSSLGAIRWDGKIGVWCGRYFARGHDGAFDSRELAEQALADTHAGDE